MAGESERERTFGEFVAARYASLIRSAYLLAGDLEEAEDLVQTALVRTYGTWRDRTDPASAEAYTRTAMVRIATRGQRRRWRGEAPVFPPPGLPAADPAADRTAELDLVDAVRQALRLLPVAQRTVLVLRYYEDRTEAEIAELLGCSAATVRSWVCRVTGGHGLVKDFLTRVAEAPDAEFHDPAGTVLHRIRVRRRRRRVAGIAVAVAVLLALLVPALPLLRPPGPRPDAAARPSPSSKTIAGLAGGHWKTLPKAPIPARSGAAATWTGRQLLVWGGVTYSRAAAPGSATAELYADGAAYDPGTARWEKLPPGPLSPRQHPASAWTGTEWLLWGGFGSLSQPSDGAAYNPATKTWRKLPPSPLRPYNDIGTAWTGKELVLLSRFYADQVAAYDPAANRWRRLPALPIEAGRRMDGTTIVSAGDRLYAWANRFVDPPGGQKLTDYGTEIFEYDRSRDRWTRPAFRGEVPEVLAGWAWVGGELIVLSRGGYDPMSREYEASGPLQGYGLNPETGVWRPTVGGVPDIATYVAFWPAGDTVLSVVGEQPLGPARQNLLVAWDKGTKRWVQLAPMPYAFVQDDAVVVWTGSELYVWGQLFPSGSGEDMLERRRDVGMRFGP